jgi:hypothetical protein
VQELIDVLWLQQITQPVFTHVTQLAVGGKGPTAQLLHRLAEKNLTTMPGGQETRETVEGGREIVTMLIRLGFPGMQRHAHPQFTRVPPVHGKEGPLGLKRSRKRSRSDWKRGLNGVADGLEMHPTMRRNRGVKNGQVAGNGRGHGLPIPLPECSTPLYVGEEEGDGAAR